MGSRFTYGTATIGHEIPADCIEGELFEGFAPKTGLWVLVGEPGSRKSLLSLYIASCLCTNRRLVALPPDDSFEGATFQQNTIGCATEQASVLFLLGEGYHGFHKRAKAAYDLIEQEVGKEALSEAFGQLPIVKMRANYIGSQEDLDTLLIQAENHLSDFRSYNYPLRLVVFDTLGLTFDLVDDNNNNHMRDALRRIQIWAEKHHLLAIVTTHPPKSRGAKKGKNKGAGDLEGMADIVWHIDKIVKSGLSRVTITKGRDGHHESEKFDYKLHINAQGEAALLPTLKDSVKHKETVRSYPKNKDSLPPKTQRVYDVIGDMRLNEKRLTPNNIFEGLLAKEAERVECEGDGIKPENLRRQMNRALDDLVTRGLLNQFNNGKNRSFGLARNPPPEITEDSAKDARMMLLREDGQLEQILEAPHVPLEQ